MTHNQSHHWWRHARYLASVALAIASVSPGYVWAGKITGVSVNPSSFVYVGEPVQVTVHGDSFCNNGVEVNFGDNSTAQDAGTFPLSGYPPHAYSHPGVYTIVAYENPDNGGGCNAATASTTIEVTAPGDIVADLCQMTDCIRAVLARDPHIDSVFFNPLPGAVQPSAPGILSNGGRLYLKGEGFGWVQGAIVISGLGSDIHLEELEWDEDGKNISGKIPNTVKALVRTPVQVYAITNHGKVSNAFNREFETPGKIEPLYDFDSAIDNVKCGADGGDNRCNGARAGGDFVCAFGSEDEPSSLITWPPTLTIKGTHSNCDGSAYNNQAYDDWEVNLNNSSSHSECVIYDVQYDKIRSSSDEVLYGPGEALIAADAIGKKVWAFRVGWKVTPSDRVSYWYNIWVKCPS